MKKKVLLKENKKLSEEVQELIERVKFERMKNTLIRNELYKTEETLEKVNAAYQQAETNFEKLRQAKEKSVLKVYSNKAKRTTCVMFSDGYKKVLKCSKGAKYDVYDAVAYAIVERIYGSNSAFKRDVDKKISED